MCIKFYRNVGLRLNTDESDRLKVLNDAGVKTVEVFRVGLEHLEKKLKRKAK